MRSLTTAVNGAIADPSLPFVAFYTAFLAAFTFMTTIAPLKQLPAPIRLLIRPTLFAAIGLHALLLFTPIPSEQKPKKTDDKENPVKITQLPTAKPAPKARPKLARPALPKVNRPKPAIAPPVQKTQTPQRATGGTPSDAKNPFADFPHYQPSTPNCYGKTDLGENCRVADVSLTALVSYFDNALSKKKFDHSPVGGDGIKVKIFQVTKQGSKVSQFLSILKDSESKTVYLLAPQPIDNLDKLKKAEGIPGAIAGILDHVSPSNATSGKPDAGSASNDATSFDFQKPDDFYSDPGAGEQNQDILGSPKIVDGQSPNQVYADLKAYLDSSEISSNQVGSYSSGTLYEINKGSFTGYLNLVPSKAGNGTIVVVWTKKPG